MAYAQDGLAPKTFPFGKVARKALERLLNSTIIAEIPLEPKVNYESLYEVLHERNRTSAALRQLLERWTVTEEK
jgi:hypothetical protein